MALPALPFVGKAIGSAGIFEGVRRAAPQVGSQLRNAGSRLTGFIGSNRGGAAGAGLLGGWGIADLSNRLGVEDRRLTLALYGLLAAAVLWAVGNVFEVSL